MTPIHLHVALIRPGTKADFTPRKSDPSGLEWISSATVIDTLDTSWFDEATVAYLPGSKTRVTDFEDEDLADTLKIVNGLTTETIFVVLSVSDQEDRNIGTATRSSWAAEYMQECGWDQLDEDTLKVLYAATLSLIERHERPAGLKLHPLHSTQKDQIVYVEFLSLWEVHTYQDFETGFSEVDGFSFVGIAKTILDPDFLPKP